MSASSYLRRFGLALPESVGARQPEAVVRGKLVAYLLSAQGLQRKLENTLTDVRALRKKMSDRLEDL